MSAVLDFFRAEEPRFKEVPDGELESFIRAEFPEFRAELLREHGPVSFAAEVPRPGEMREGASPVTPLELAGLGGPRELGILVEAPEVTEEQGLRMKAAEQVAERWRSVIGAQGDPVRRAELGEEARAELAELGVGSVEGEASLARGVGGVLEAVSTPLVSLPRVDSAQRVLGEAFGQVAGEEAFAEVAPGAKAGAVASGVQKGAAGAAEFFTSPLGIATLGLGSLPAATQRAIAGAFAIDMARHTPEIFRELGTAVGNGDMESAVELGVAGALNTIFTAGAGLHGLRPGPKPVGEMTKGEKSAYVGRELERVFREIQNSEFRIQNEASPLVREVKHRGTEAQRGIRQEVAKPVEEAAKPVEVEKPAEAAGKAREHVAEVAAVEGQRPAKAVKGELVARLEEALELAPEEPRQSLTKSIQTRLGIVEGQIERAPKLKLDTKKLEAERKQILQELAAEQALDKVRSATIKIEIPGDGTFTIRNTKAVIEQVLKRARKMSTRSIESDRAKRREPGDVPDVAKAREVLDEFEKRVSRASKEDPHFSESQAIKEKRAQLQKAAEQAERLNEPVVREEVSPATVKQRGNAEGSAFLEASQPGEIAPAGGGKQGGSLASVGDYRTGVLNRGAAATPGARSSGMVELRLGGMEHVRPVEMPELVRLARELTGSVPFLKRYKAARGRFYAVGEGRIGLNPEVFKEPMQAAATLAHEIGHLVDYLPERALDRGNLLGRLAVLREWMVSTFPKGPGGGAPLSGRDRGMFRREAERAFKGDRAAQKAEYERLVAAEIEQRGLAKLGDVYGEAWELSKWWKPIDEAAVAAVDPGHLRYRKSGIEVYADALSVLLNAPAELKARAPKFWEMFFNYLERKPEVKRAFLEVQELLARGPEAVRGDRLKASRESFMKAEEILLEKIREREAARTSFDGFWRKLTQENVDHGQILTERVAAVRKSGKEVPTWADPRNAWEANLFADNRNMLDMERVWERVVKPVESAGLDTVQLGQVLELQRIMGYADPRGFTHQGALAERKGTRVGLANPQGLAFETARETLTELYSQVGPEQAAVLEQAAGEFRKLVFERVTEGTEWGIYSRETYERVFAPNQDSYVAFRGLDHVDAFVTPMARQAKGSLVDIENPLTTTLYKLASLNNLIAVQKTKFLTRDFMGEHFPESWLPAERYHTGTEWRDRRPRNGLERLEMLEDGQVRGYDVDPYVAKAFERLTPAEVSSLMKLLDWPFRNLIYPLIIKYNPGFQFFSNPIRDFKRTSRNVGALAGVSRWGLVKEYLRAFRDARGFVKGELSPLTREMLSEGAIGTPMDSFNQLNRADPLGEMMKRYRLAPKAEQGRILRGLLWVPRQVEFAGSVLEALPKIGSYRAVIDAQTRQLQKRQGGPVSPEQMEWMKDEAAVVVRNYAGTPNFKVKGLHGNVGNVVIPFLNIFMQGYKSDFKLATTPKTAGGWWFRWMLHDGSMAVLQGLAAAGVMGVALKEMYGGISEHDKSNYLNLPLGYQIGGEHGRKVVHVRIPRDETSRFLSAAVNKAVRVLAGDKSAREFPTELFDVGAGIVPTISPLLQIGTAWTDYLRGQNPIDPWRGRPVIGSTEFKAGGWESLKPMGVFTLDRMGTLNFIRWNPESETMTELVVSGLPVLNRAVKISDYGYAEQQRAAENEEERLKAVMRLDYSTKVRGALSEYYRLQGLGRRRNAAQEVRYEALSVWHRVYRKFDEESWLAEQRGEKEKAKALRKDFARATEEFEREGRLEWAPVKWGWDGVVAE